MKNRDTSLAKPSVHKPLKLEVKVLQSHLRYVLLGENSTLHVTIAAELSEGKIKALISELKRFKREIDRIL